MAKTLRANVYVDGVLYGPAGKDPTAAIARRITNPKAWTDPESKAGDDIDPESKAGDDAS